MSEKHEWVAKRAYELWEQAGHPDGQDQQHWQDASEQWDCGKRTSEILATSPGGSDWDDEEEREH